MEWMGAIVQDDMQLGQNPPVRHRRQLHRHNITGLVDQSVKSFGVYYPPPAAPAHNSIEDSTGHQTHKTSWA